MSEIGNTSLDGNVDDLVKELNSSLNRNTSGIDARVLQFLFSDNELNIIQLSDLNDEGLRIATILESLDHFIIKEFCRDANQRKNFSDFKKKIYLMRVSYNRKGRLEIFEVLKGVQNMFNFNNNKKDLFGK